MKNINIIKKIIALSLAVGLFSTTFSACSTKEPEVIDEKFASYGADAFANIEPLEEAVALNIGALSSSTHGFTNYLIQKLGGYELANIDANVKIFGNGPIMVEAMVSGDCDAGPYGLGGTLAGTIGQGFINLGAASRDYHALQFFSPNDSDIVKSGKGETGIYGTAEDWKGQEIFVPVGTTLHYSLSKGLEKIGLTPDDVKLTHMEVPNINTALRAGKCEVGGVWTNYPYGDLTEKSTAVMKAEDTDVILVTSFATTPAAMSDPNKQLAMEKWMELYFAAVDWMYASDENLTQCVDWFIEWNDENGIASVREEIEAHCKYQRCYTLEENIEMFGTQSELGDYSLMVEYNVEPLRFFVDQGNYKPEDIDTFLQPEYFNTTFIDRLSAK